MILENVYIYFANHKPTLVKKRNTFFLVGAGLLLMTLIYKLLPLGASAGETSLLTEVKKGSFEINVNTTGELQANSSENIMGPSRLRQVGVWQVKITDLVPEGSRVKKGDYIGMLDRSEISGHLKDLESELQKSESEYTKTKLDTTLEMRTARNELINLNSAVEEKSIVLEQSKYEPPAMIRQAQLELEKAQRALEQAKKNYQLKMEQAVAKMKEVTAALSQAQRKHEEASSVVDEFEIKAPKDGMLIYEKDWDGKKKIVGTTISAWDPVVATLPDLSSMISKTYVNEVDISKIKVDQHVEIGIDAFPEKKFKGRVIEVANVGEQRPKSDSKVFEVKIKMQGSDTLLRPSMTTSNKIMTSRYDNVLHIPLECIHSSDSISYVFVKEGFNVQKKQVKLGLINDSEAIIAKGLTEGENVYLSKPEDADDLELQKLH